MTLTFKLGRVCPVCGVRVSDKNKSGYCNLHRDRSGANNPFYGKHHIKENIEKGNAGRREATAQRWQDPDYRAYTINAISKPRPQKFKEEQSERIKEWYTQNPEQRDIRSISMAKNWKDGVITKNSYSCNRSKIEQKFFDELSALYPDITQKTIKYKNAWLFPDIITVDDLVIIEFYGNFWHANPRIYGPYDIAGHNTLAKDIWQRDEKRLRKLYELGHSVYIVWEDEYRNSPDEILYKLDRMLNWETCCL